MNDKIILGHIEDVAIPTFGVDGVVAKVDTGAFSGALHCTDITLDGEERLSFNPLGRQDLRMETTAYEMRAVRSASGHASTRFVVPVVVRLQGRDYPTKIGITDRADMKYEMLLGRRFLREHGMLVDVSRNGEHDTEWRRRTP